ncbi:PPE domain-containing protein [Lentzea chajnantorensis]
MVEHRWQGYSHEELYARIHAGPGAAASHTSVERWAGVSSALSEINDDLHRGIAKSGARWQGRAAEQAAAGMNPLAAWADGARGGADVMRYSAELQADHIAKARADMPAPVKVTAEQPNALVSGIVHLFGGQTDHEQQEAAADSAERRAREVMATYASSTTANTSTLGQFTQPPQLQISASGITSSSGPGVHTPGGWVFGPHGGTGTGPRTRTGSGSRGSTTAPPRGGSGTAPGTTTRSSGVSPAATTGRGTGSTSLSSAGQAGTAGTSGPAGTGAAGVGTTGAVPGQRTGNRSSSSAGTGEVKEMEEGATASSSAAVGQMVGHSATVNNAGGAHGSSMGPLGTVGGQNNDRVHQRSVPLPQSYDPFGGMGPRKGEDEEDLEHKAADYLRERDDIYGIGSYALPVIGESTTD